MTRTLEITEVVLRDAHQSLLATRMALEDMLPALEDLDNAGYWSLECWGGATFDSCIRFLNEDPWQRLRTFKKLCPKTPLQMLLRGQNLLGYRHYADDVVDRFVDKAAANGMDVFRVFDALNDPRNLQRSMAAVKKTGKHAQGAISYTVSPVHTLAAYADLAKRLQDMGADSICIKDMAALIKPQAAFDLVTAIKAACGPAMRVHLHVHATTGVTLVSIAKAIEAGLDGADAAVSSMSLGTGHNPTEAVAEMLEGTGVTHRLDLARVEKVKDHFTNILPRYQKFLTRFVGVETAIFRSQIPGGMLSNMESQLKDQGAGDRLREVLEEVPRVRQDAGYPPLVTPSSQIVGTQAVFNVLFGRYQKLSGEFADLMLGYYGATSAPANPEVVALAQKQASKDPITCRPADLLGAEWDKLANEGKALPGADGSDEDILTYALFPKVAPGFFKTRAQGPKYLGADPATAAQPTAAAPLSTGPRSYSVTVNGQTFAVTVSEGGAVQSATPVAAAAPSPAPVAGSETVKAALAGTVLRLVKQPGSPVAVDEVVMVIEAMKMETEIVSPKAGTLTGFQVAEGAVLNVGQPLFTIA